MAGPVSVRNVTERGRDTIPPPPPEQPRGFLSDIVLNAIEPGVNASVLFFLNVVFVLLLATLVGVSIVTGFSIHILIFGVLAVGLMVGFNIFITALVSTEELQKDMSTNDELRTKAE